MMIKKMCCFCFGASVSSLREEEKWICPHCGKDISTLPTVSEEESFSEEYIKTILQYKEDSYQFDTVEERARMRERSVEAEVKHLHDQTEMILQAAGEGIFGLDIQGNITFINPAALKMLGFRREELLYHKIHQLVYRVNPEGEAEECPFVQAMQEGIPQLRTTDNFLRKNGASFPVEYVVSCIRKNGAVAGAVCIFKDISEQLLAQKQIREAKEQLESFINHTTDAIAIVDLEGILLSVNTAYEMIFGWKKEELVGQAFPIIFPNLYEEYKMNCQRVMAGEKLTAMESIRRHKDGTLINVNVTYSPVHNGSGEVVAIASTIRDMRDRKQIERELKESEERYRQLVEFSPDAMLVHCDNRVIYVNPAAMQMFGAKNEEELIEKPAIELVHPDSQQLARSRMAFLQNDHAKVEPLYEKLVRLNGEVVDTEVTAMAFLYQNKPAVLCIIRDITDRMKVEAALRASEEKLRQITDHSSDVICQMDQQFVIEYINQACNHEFGYTQEEIVGKSIVEFIHPDDRKMLTSEITRCMRSMNSCKTEIRLRHAKSHYIWLEVAISFILDDQGKCESIILVSRNVTERKQADEMIQKQERLLKGVADAAHYLLTMPEEFGATIHKVLTILGTNADVDRVYVYENHHDPQTNDLLVSHRYEWVRDSVEPQLSNPLLQNISYKKMGISRWYDRLSSGGLIVGLVKDLPEEETRLLESQGSLSFLIVPIFVGDTFWGFIGFNDCNNERVWSINEEAILIAAAASIGGAIRRYNQEELLKRDIEERIKVERELAATNQILQEISSVDGLTGIPNRRFFDENYQKEWNRALRNNKPLSIIMFDIDFFKGYNDSYGHQAGDDCLKQVAQLISAPLRRPGDFAARYGGEEFIVVLPETDCAAAAMIAEKIRHNVETAQFPHNQSSISPYVTISGGIASTIPTSEQQPKTLIATADKNLYEAKQKGRNQVVIS
ncbi:PAS domain S-box protein [Brevibacillus ginsengisoli]|uniref:PAS domain S-box protein n=1 Tax=Brevibacillus ginsengisoli TaxID=363854 RepID=UPI003CF2BF2B